MCHHLSGRERLRVGGKAPYRRLAAWMSPDGGGAAGCLRKRLATVLLRLFQLLLKLAGPRRDLVVFGVVTVVGVVVVDVRDDL